MPPAQRKVLAIVAAGLVLLVAAFGWMRWYDARRFDERHARWLREQRPLYDQMASNVMAQKTLTSEPRDLGGAVPPALKIWACTNADGSVTIMFSGGEGGPRHGYIYHTGALLTNPPWASPGESIYHLTNQWYEY